MKEALSVRLSLVMSKLGLNMNQLSKALDFQNSVVGNIINQRNLPSFDFLLRLKKYEKRIDLNWIFTGEGEMFIKTEGDTENIEIYRDLSSALKRENELLREKLALNEQSNDCKNKKVS